MTTTQRSRKPGTDRAADGGTCVALNDLLGSALAAERRCVWNSCRAQQLALRAELMLRAAEHAGDAERLRAALVYLRCAPDSRDVDATSSDPPRTPPLTEPDDAELLHGFMAEEAEHMARLESALRLSALPDAVRATLELCWDSAQRAANFRVVDAGWSIPIAQGR